MIRVSTKETVYFLIKENVREDVHVSWRSIHRYQHIDQLQFPGVPLIKGPKAVI